MNKQTLSAARAFATFGFLAINRLALLPAQADVRLPHVFASDMVLQRDVPIRVWGWAAPREKVVCELGKQKATATANSDGQWMVELPKMQAGGPYEMTVRGRN